MPAPSPDVERPATGVGFVPAGVKAASEWSWRLLLIAAGLVGLVLLVRSVSQVIVPIAIALLLTALLRPIALRLRAVMPAGAAAGLTVVTTIVVITTLLTLVSSQFTSGLSDLTSKLADGLSQIRDWVRTTFNITDAQFNDYFDTIRDQVSSRAMAIGTTTCETERTSRARPKRPAAMSSRRHDHSLAALTPAGTTPTPVAGRLRSGGGAGL